jgi:two-component system cell cycle response regulator
MSQSTRLLIIDDDAIDQKLIQESIKRGGLQAEVIVAFSGEEGIKKVNDLRPNVIIVLDTVLPGMNGFETCRKIKEIDENFKIIICTGVIDAVDAAKARAFGADDYCVKTADYLGLINAIRKLIGT